MRTARIGATPRFQTLVTVYSIRGQTQSCGERCRDRVGAGIRPSGSVSGLPPGSQSVPPQALSSAPDSDGRACPEVHLLREANGRLARPYGTLTAPPPTLIHVLDGQRPKNTP